MEDLIRQPEESYAPPELPIRWDDLLPGLGTDLPSFGHEMRDAHFLLDRDWTFINHGAFGAPLRIAVEVGNRWRLHNARQPLRFVDRQLFQLIVWALRQLAAEVKAAPDEVAFVPNATTGLNTVIKSIHLNAGDEVYMLNIGYGSVKKMLAYQCEQAGAHVREGEITFPLAGPNDILEVVSNTLRPNTRLAIFDHITSNTGLVMPIEDLIELCHSRGVPVFIDGAHGLGSLPLDLRALGADFYVGNCHKWFCCTPGCAFLYVRNTHSDGPALRLDVVEKIAKEADDEGHEERKTNDASHVVHPLVISHGFGEGFTSNFIWSGYHDYSSVLTFPAVLALWKRIGLERVWSYNIGLLHQAVDLLRSRWDASLVAPMEMHRTMALVSVPDGVVASGKPTEASSTDAKILQDTLHYRYMIEVPVKCVQGRLYVRLSAHLYNQLSDYERLADAMHRIALHGFPSWE